LLPVPNEAASLRRRAKLADWAPERYPLAREAAVFEAT
jgi:hypothetical protein